MGKKQIRNNKDIDEFLENNLPDSNHKKSIGEFFKNFPEIYTEIKQNVNKSSDCVITANGIIDMAEEISPIETNLFKIEKFINQRGKAFNQYKFYNYLFFYCESNNKDSKYILYNIKERRYTTQNLSTLKDFIEGFVRSRLMRSVFDFFNIDYSSENPEKEKSKALDILIRARTILIDGIDYVPEDKIVFIRDSSLYLNNFIPGNYFSYYSEKEDYNFPWIDDFIFYLCGSNKKIYDYLLKLMAWKLQNPTKKVPTSLVIISTPGVGKQVFKDNILTPIYGYDNIKNPDGEQILEGWADSWVGCLFTVVDEIAFNSKRDYENFKGKVSNQYITGRRKHRDSEAMVSYSNVIIFTNRYNPIKIENPDRRFNVTEVREKRSESYIGELVDEKIPEELPDFVSYLKNMEVDYQDISVAFSTEIKKDIQNIHRHPAEKFMSVIREEGLEEVHRSIMTKVPKTEIQQTNIPVNVFYTLFTDYLKSWGTPQSYQISPETFSKMLSTNFNLKSKTSRDKYRNTKRCFNIYDILGVSEETDNNETVNKDITPKAEDVEVEEDL